MGVEFTSDLAGLKAEMLEGFFVGWPVRPSGKMLLQLLEASKHRWLAILPESRTCVGYVTALSDGMMFASISSLEVLPDYQGQGIGQELMARMMGELSGLYAIDLVCDPNVQPFYERCGLQKCTSMVHRNREALIAWSNQ